MLRPTSIYERLRHDGRCAPGGGPLRLDAVSPTPLDYGGVVVPAIVRLRARIAAWTKADGPRRVENAAPSDRGQPE